MPISRSQMLKQLVPGLNGLFGQEYDRYEEEHTYIYETESSERSFEEEVLLSGFGSAPVKSEGAGIHYDVAQETWTARYVHETIAMGFALTEESMEDNLYADVAKRYTKALARAMAHTKQVKGAFPLNQAYSTTNFTAGDGLALCGIHLTTTGGNNTNYLTTAAQLSETSLEAATIAIAAFTDQRGLIIAAKPYRLIIPQAEVFAATRILESNLRVSTADNDINALRNNGTIPDGYAINHYLSNTDNWFLITDVPNGMKCFKRAERTTGMDGDFDTGNVRYKARERYSFGVSDPLGIYGSGNIT